MLAVLLACCGAVDLVDPQTRNIDPSALTKEVDGQTLTLVMSDEFEADVPAGAYSDRVLWNSSTHEPGVKWSVTNTLSYNTYGDCYMAPEMVKVSNGVLNITAKKERRGGSSYIGGQLTSWNRVCFQGGFLEVRYKNPGRYGMDGLWPAIWTMGALLRDNFMIRNRKIWPYSYSDCQCGASGTGFHGVGFAPPSFSACTAKAHHGMNAFQGRGAPELDLLETTKCSHFYTDLALSYGVAKTDSCLLQSTQIGPRLDWTYRPINFFEPDSNRPWYGMESGWQTSDEIQYWNDFFINTKFYGLSWYDSIGAVVKINETTFSEWHTVGMNVAIDDACEMHQYPNVPLNASMAAACRLGSKVEYWADGKISTRLAGIALGAKGVTTARQVPQEPLYILLELKISPSAGFGTPPADSLPVHFLIDYVRLYQRVDSEHPARLSCSPPDHPTAELIRALHTEYGVPKHHSDPALIHLQTWGENALTALGVLITLFGSNELSFLCNGIQALSLGLLILVGVLVSTGYASELIWGVLVVAYPPLGIVLFGLASILSGLMNLASFGAAFGLLIVEMVWTFDSSFTAVVFWVPASIALALMFIGAIVGVQGPILYALGSSLFGSVACAFGVAELLGCHWLDALYTYGLPTCESAQTGGIFACNLLGFLMGFGLQIMVHCKAGRLALGCIALAPPSEPAPGVSRQGSLQPEALGSMSQLLQSTVRVLYRIARGNDGLTRTRGPASALKGVVSMPMKFVRNLKIRRNSKAGSERVERIHWSAVDGYDGLYQDVATGLQLRFGLQGTSMRVQCYHLHQLLKVILSRPKGCSEETAARELHTQLLDNYRKWCHRIDVVPLSCGVLTDCMLYLGIWGEAANLRHMPELLCWLYHKLCEMHIQNESSGKRAEVLCSDFAGQVVQPLYETASKRMKADKVTYDDMNEFFWQSDCLAFHPFLDSDKEVQCISKGLAECSKTHMESNSWFHLFACFGDLLFLILAINYVLLVLAFSIGHSDNWLLFITRISSVIYIYDVWISLSELLALWVEMKFELLLDTWFAFVRAIASLLYVCTTGILVFTGLFYQDCSSGSVCARPTDDVEVNLNYWIAFWSLTVVRHTLLGWVSRFALPPSDSVKKDTCLGILRRILQSPRNETLERLGKSKGHYEPRYPGARWSILFWFVVLAVYAVFMYFLAFVDATMGFASVRSSYTQGYVSISEFSALMIAWVLPLLPIGLIMLDTIVQLAVLTAALLHMPKGRVPVMLTFTNFGAKLKHTADQFARKLVSHTGRSSTFNSGRISSLREYSVEHSVKSTSSIDQLSASVPPSPPSTPPGGDEAAAASPAKPADVEIGVAAETESEREEIPQEIDSMNTQFAICWDAIIDELRADDLISNNEARAMRFHDEPERITEPVAARDLLEEFSTSATRRGLHVPAILAEDESGRNQFNPARGARWARHVAQAAGVGKAVPANEEARRRLRSFVSSLNCEMPTPPAVTSMGSFSVLVPTYKETVIFSFDELGAVGSDGRPLLTVLRDLCPDEWDNFCERTGLDRSTITSELTMLNAPACKTHGLEVRLWASMRGQTLARTVRGMMQYEKALLLQARLEDSTLSRAAAMELVQNKFEMVVACQMYGEWKASGHEQQKDVDILLRRYPGLRIAYPEPVFRPVYEVGGPGSAGLSMKSSSSSIDDSSQTTSKMKDPRRKDRQRGIDAVLAMAGPDETIHEMGRVSLPGNPILGEGKPENQNIALQFTRGQRLMIVDMNQDGYLEEAFKIRNLLEEFEPTDSSDPRPVTLVGYPEHIFSQSAGFATSIYAAMQERYFGTFFQRVLVAPLDVRMHYGHPDLADKLHFMTRGGVSKASKSINLSEDVFAGYKTTLRGGRSLFKEYHQCGKGRGANLLEVSGFFSKLSQGCAYQLMSRDVYRVSQLLPLERKVGMFFSAFGYYVCNAVVMYSVHIMTFCYALLAVTGLLPTFVGMTISILALTTWMPFIAMLMLMMPDVILVCVEEGIGGGLKYLTGKIITMAPLYYVFIAQTRAYALANTLRFGKGGYFATKRSVSVQHQSLIEIYQSYSRSHFVPAFDILTMLSIATLIDSSADFGYRVWSYWLIVAAMIVPPFLYNPLALNLRSLIADINEFDLWMSRGGLNGMGDEGGKTWNAWFEKVTPSPKDMSQSASLLGALFMSSIYFYLAINLLPRINPVVGMQADGQNGSASWGSESWWQLSLGIALLLPFLCIALFDTVVDTRTLRPQLRHARTALISFCPVAVITWYLCVVLLKGEAILGPNCPFHGSGGWYRIWYSIPVALWHALDVHLFFSGSAYALSALQLYIRFARDVLRVMHRARDCLMHAVLVTPMLILSVLWIFQFIHNRIVFQPTPVFFSRGPKGTGICFAYCAVFLVLLILWILYKFIELVGQVPTVVLDPFLCS